MEYKGLRFKTLKSFNKTPLRDSKGTNSKLGAGVEFLQTATIYAMEFSIGHQAQRQLKGMSESIKHAMGDFKGVLVVAHIKEWEINGATGARGKMLYSISIAGAGNDYNQVYQSYHALTRLNQGPGKGWRHSGSEYFWVTGDKPLANYKLCH